MDRCNKHQITVARTHMSYTVLASTRNSWWLVFGWVTIKEDQSHLRIAYMCYIRCAIKL